MYQVTATETHNEKANDFETKSMLFLINYYSNANDVHFLVVDFFNDITGVNRLQDSCFDVQSKGISNIAPADLGKYLVTLYKNYLSDFNFTDFILFVQGVSPSIFKETKANNIFNLLDINNKKILSSIKKGLKDEAFCKTYINNDRITEESIDDFFKKVTIVIDSHSKEEYIRDAVEMSSNVNVSNEYLRKIFKEIRDKQSAKKNNDVEGEIISEISMFYQYDKHITKNEIQSLIINRICFNSALADYKHIPNDFHKLISCFDETIKDDRIEDCQNAIFKLLNDKNNKNSFWDLFVDIIKLLGENKKADLNEIYDKLDKEKVENVHHLDPFSTKYFIAIVKENLNDKN